MNTPLHIAVAGLGTVGAGTLKLLQTHGEMLRQRCGRPIVVVAVSARDKGRDRGVDLGGIEWYDDAAAMAAGSGVEVVVELIGGADGVAKAVCEAAIASGKHVVTANKALLAHHGTALALAAEAKGVSLGFEAAVAGGVPIIKALREGLAANGLSRIYGILNGTCNYILTAMRETGAKFEAVLADAQALGYAEADPSLDIDGIDTAHKLAILTSVAFGCEINFPAVYIEGIRDISSLDIRFAGELGYEIKLLGIARLTGSGVEQRVHPCLVPLGAPIAHVEGVFNAVVADGDFVDTTIYEGRGAGAGPTASAVVADLVDIARGHRVPAFAVPAAALAKIPAQPMERHRGAYYIRLMVVDKPGVIADVTAAFRDEEISLESMLQRGRAPDEAVPVILITHDTEESAMSRALEKIAILEAVAAPPRMIRIEGL
ncbi:MAG: homoserine dehydrogenase [Proteobacteria bacterium]|nr:homoserine dehydrogenase [Pseudomonadota bacterium]